MCEIWDLGCRAGDVAGDLAKDAAGTAAGAVADSIVGRLADMVGDAQTALITSTVTWWLRLPPVDVGAAPVVRTLQEWMLPFALVMAVGGIMWQSLLMIVNRKGEPLIAMVKGLFATAVWGAVSVTGTQLLLGAAEAYTEWVLTLGMDCAPGIGQDTACKIDALSGRMQLMLAPTVTGVGAILVLIVGLVVLFATVTQAVLLLFRNGAILILAGMLQLAAAGSFTGATANWLRRVLGWLLALVFYEPLAATCYAVGFMLIGDRENTDIATWFTGAGLLGLSLVALPAMMRFFNWTVGAVQTSGNSAGVIAAAGAAGLHAIASRRGAAGLGVVDYAREADRRSGPAPGGVPDGAGRGRSAPPLFTGPSGGGATGSGAAAGTATATAASGTTTATAASGTTTAAAAGTTGAAASGATGAAGAGAAAAAGPAAPVVVGAVVGAKIVSGTARAAGAAGARGTEGG